MQKSSNLYAELLTVFSSGELSQVQAMIDFFFFNGSHTDKKMPEEKGAINKTASARAASL